MRIGIITLGIHVNYGGILQAYALQTALERMGHTVQVIGFPLKFVPLPKWMRPLSFVKRFIQHYILGKKEIAINRARAEYERQLVIGVHTMKFIHKYIHQRIVTSLNEIQPNDYDALVVGSDQIWRPHAYLKMWENQKIDDVFLGFTKGWNIKRVAYAASFGTEKLEIPKKDLSVCIEDLKRFNAISTREESGVRLCKEHLDAKAVWMPDPTFLLTKNDYESLLTNYHSPQENCESRRKQLLSYVLDETPESILLRESIAKDRNLSINITNKVDNWKEGQETKPQPPVEEWLLAFEESDFVFTDSFHACAFSIIFHKQFAVIANIDRGLARITSILKMFGLESRLIKTFEDYKKLSKIDYTKVEDIIKRKRSTAIKFIEEGLDSHTNTK